MRKLALTAVLASVIAVPAMAQQPMPWTTELGIRSTFASLDVDGTGVTLIDLPAGGGIEGFGGGSALYAVFPVGHGGRLAVEPSFGYSDQNIGTSITTMTAGARVLFSVWRGAYIGAGPMVNLLKVNGEEDARFGVNVAGGYRIPVGGVVTLRGEVFYESMGEGDLFATQSSSEIGLALGLGMGLGGPIRTVEPADGYWELALGVQGGYTHVSVPGQIDLSSFTLPGGGSNSGLIGFPITSVSPWFVTIPVGERFAVEPSFSYHSYSVEDDAGSGSFYEVGVKGNYAFTRGFYAGLSAEMLGMGGDDFDGVDGWTGVGAQTGLRFPLVGKIKGRVEVNYRVFSAGDNSPLGDYQAFGTTFGVTAPLK